MPTSALGWHPPTSEQRRGVQPRTAITLRYLLNALSSGSLSRMHAYFTTAISHVSSGVAEEYHVIMLTASATDQLALATALAAIVTTLIGIFRPFIELLPFARPTASTHDATLRLLNLALNVGLVIAAAAASGGLNGSAWLALGIQALAQASGSHIIFHSVTASASAASAPVSAPASTAASAPAASASASAPVPSLATLAAPTAANVASAINDAIKQQGMIASK